MMGVEQVSTIDYRFDGNKQQKKNLKKKKDTQQSQTSEKTKAGSIFFLEF